MAPQRDKNRPHTHQAANLAPYIFFTAAIKLSQQKNNARRLHDLARTIRFLETGELPKVNNV